MYTQDLALNNPQWLICHQTKLYFWFLEELQLLLHIADCSTISEASVFSCENVVSCISLGFDFRVYALVRSFLYIAGKRAQATHLFTHSFRIHAISVDINTQWDTGILEKIWNSTSNTLILYPIFIIIDIWKCDFGIKLKNSRNLFTLKLFLTYRTVW